MTEARRSSIRAACIERSTSALAVALSISLAACGSTGTVNNSSLDQKIDQIWIDLARSEEIPNLCGSNVNEEETRTDLEKRIAENYQLGPDEASDALDELIQRCDLA